MASRDLNILIKAQNLASGAIKGVKGELRGIGRDVQRGLGNAARNIERGIFIAGGAAVAGLGLAVKTAMDFETAFAGVQKTVDATATMSMPALRRELEKLSTIKPQSFEELSQIGEFGGQLGVKADDLASFVDTVSDFLVAVPGMGLEEAAFGLERIRLLTGAARDELDETASVVVELGNNYSTTESAIIGTAERFASSAKQAGLSTAATLGLSAAVTALGGEPQEAGTSLQRLFQNINLALAEGGPKAELFAEVSGQSAADFRRNWTRDAEGTLLDFLEGMGQLSDDSIEQTRILDELGLADARLGKNVLNLSNNIDVTRSALESANAEWVANGALTEEAQKRYETAAAQFDILKNNLRLAAATIGTEVLPVLLELSKEFTDFLQEEGTQRRIREFAKSVGEGVRDLVDWLKSLDWEGIGRSLETAAGFARGVVEAFLSMPGWVQQAVVTGWGLNKLTGGALGSIIGQLGAGLIKGVLGINAGVVNVNAPVANMTGAGAGAGAAGAGRGKFPIIPVTAAIAVAAVAGGGPMGEDSQIQFFRQLLDETSSVQEAVNRSQITLGNIHAAASDPAFRKGLTTDQLAAIDALAVQIAPLPGALNEVSGGVAEGNRYAASQVSATQQTVAHTQAVAARVADQRAALDRGFSSTNSQLGSGFSATNAQLGSLNAKSWNTNVNVTTLLNLSVYSSTSRLTQSIRRQQQATGRGFQEGIA